MKFRLALAAIALIAAPVTIASAQNWNTEIVETERGHLVGNPDAPIQLITFESYTCPACKRFETQSEASLRLEYIHSGRAAVEMRTVIHSPVDLAASLAVACGPAGKWLANHQAMIHAQDDFLAKIRAASDVQKSRWSYGYLSQRMRAIATDLGFYDLMERRGYSYGEIDRCLTDEASAITISNNAAADAMEFAIPGTPSFAINGQLVAEAYSWDVLRPALDAVSQ